MAFETEELTKDEQRWCDALVALSSDQDTHYECCFRQCMLRVAEQQFRGMDPDLDSVLDALGKSEPWRPELDRRVRGLWRGEHEVLARAMNGFLAPPSKQETAVDKVYWFGSFALEAGVSSDVLVAMLKRADERAQNCPTKPKSWWQRLFG